MIKDRRVSAGDIQRYVGEMAREIESLEQQLASLRAAHGGTGTGSGTGTGTGSGTGAGTGTGRRRGRPPGRRSGAAAGTGAGGGTGAGAPARRRGRPPASAGAQSGGEGEGTGGGEQAGAGRRGRRGRRAAITPEQLASRQLQGRYLALIRQVPENRRAQYAKIAKEKGREAAIKELQDVVKK
ncbi:MAG TPA: hypothetical protein VGR02_07195 [Thermoanaerobaculia bacterium]|nr:hypothetical protein [Thermoanaerobaculia bacterium]